MDDASYNLQALLQAPVIEGDLERLRYFAGRLPLLVSRIEASIRNEDRAQLRVLAHNGKGLYTGLGRAGDYFTHLYTIALSATTNELEQTLAALRLEAAMMGTVLERLDQLGSAIE